MISFSGFFFRVTLAVVSMVACLFMVSCGYKDAVVISTGESEPVTVQTVDYGMIDSGPVSGGTLKLFYVRPDTFNPLLTKNVFVKEMLAFIYEPLIKTGNDLRPLPWLAASWSVSADKLVYTFILQDGIFWHDGMPLTTADVEFSFRTIKSAGSESPYYEGLRNVKTLTGIDRLQFKLILDQPDSFTAESMDFPVIPAHIGLPEGLTDKDFLEMNGTGPFKVSEYINDEFAGLQKNEHWWASKEIHDMEYLLPYLDAIEFRVSSGAGDIAGMFQTHDIDAAFLNREENSRFSGRTDIANATYIGSEFEFLALNTTSKLLKDAALRYTISMMVNRETIVDALFTGRAIASEFPLVPGNWLENDGSAGVITHDAEETDASLHEMGWKKVNDKLYKTIDGKKYVLSLDLIVNNENEDRKRIAGFITDVLNEHSIGVNIVGLDWDDYISALADGKYDLALAGCKVCNVPDLSFMFASSSVYKDGVPSDRAWNIARFRNNEVDMNLIKIRELSNDTGRIACFNEIRAISRNEVPYIGLFFYRNTALYAKKVRGILEPSVWNRYNDITRWYITNQ